MKKLDKYITKNFLIGYVIAFCVLIGLRVVIDLFVNLDEFAEQADLGTISVITQMLKFYGTQILLYYRDFAGMITVTAAVFTFGKMVRNNELIAVMASGVSLKRVLLPILLISLVLTAVYVVNQEILIPSSAEQLVRKHDTLEGTGNLDIWFLSDENGSLICSPNFDVKTGVLHDPVIFLRKKVEENYYTGIGQIRADSASYLGDGKWELVNGVKMLKPEDPLTGQNKESVIEYYLTDLTPEEIPVRRKANFMDLLSSAQLQALLAQGPKIKDRLELFAQRHERITTPIINFIMLLIALPILVCREPKALKSAVLISFSLTTGCFIISFICKMLAGEGVLIRPELWSWLPIAIFFPIAILEFDSMKT